MNDEKSTIYLGIDIGSTTAKLVAVENGEIIYSTYERHLSQVRQKTAELIDGLRRAVGDRRVRAAVSGW